jgi:uncharacterized protein (DUF1697 family)
MAIYVALLRGINVGGRNKIPMADLRAAVSSLGYQDVTTYIQSGNVLFGAPELDTTVLAEAIRAEIARTFSLNIDVVVVSKQDLAQIIGDSPYPADPKFVHVVFFAAEPDQALRDKIAAIAAAKGSANGMTADSVTVAGRAMYLHTPAGYGTSDLAKALVRLPGTARNWATTTKLLELIGPPAPDPNDRN